MNPEQQRIAIAEACGWKNADHPDVMKLKQGWSMPEKWCMDQKGVLRFNNDRPNYLNDLNAMHDAEKVLAENNREQYLNILYEVCNQHSMLNDAWNLNCATASQRAEAFLRTIGKWKESKP